MHQVEGLVDIFKAHGVSDHLVDLDLALHILVDQAGKLGAPAHTTKGGATAEGGGIHTMLAWAVGSRAPRFIAYKNKVDG